MHEKDRRPLSIVYAALSAENFSQAKIISLSYFRGLVRYVMASREILLHLLKNYFFMRYDKLMEDSVEERICIRKVCFKKIILINLKHQT